MELTGDPVPVVDHVAINLGTTRPLFSASDNGVLVYQSGEASGSWNPLWLSREGKQIGSIPQSDFYVGPSLSPDGTRLAIEIFSGTHSAGDIWVFDLTRGSNTRLTFGPASQQAPVWTADGKTIFYGSNPKGVSHIYAKASDGSGTDRVVLETTDVTEFPESFSPDGRYLVYTRRPKGEIAYHIWVLPLFGDGKPFPIVQTAFDSGYPQISPEGKWMVYQTNESGRREIYITAFPAGGAKWQVSTNGGTAARWRRDGKELFFLDPA
jgi:Tol biopolymer transport system component